MVLYMECQKMKIFGHLKLTTQTMRNLLNRQARLKSFKLRILELTIILEFRTQIWTGAIINNLIL